MTKNHILDFQIYYESEIEENKDSIKIMIERLEWQKENRGNPESVFTSKDLEELYTTLQENKALLEKLLNKYSEFLV